MAQWISARDDQIFFELILYNSANIYLQLVYTRYLAINLIEDHSMELH